MAEAFGNEIPKLLVSGYVIIVINISFLYSFIYKTKNNYHLFVEIPWML